MTAETEAKIMRERLERRIIECGTNATAVSVKGGRNRTYLRDYFSGRKKRISTEFLTFCAKFLDTPIEYFTGDIESPSPPAIVGRLIPLYSASFALSDDGRFRFQKTADVACPPGLLRITGPYAVAMAGDTMQPRFQTGNRLFVDPSRLMERSDNVVVQVAIDGEHFVYVKEFVDIGSRLILKQLNPENRMSVPVDRVIAAHVISFVELKSA